MDKKPLVLIIDDDEGIRDMVRIKLEASGFSVEESENGEDGIKKAKKLKPNIILLDIIMPVMDGVDVLVELKKEAILESTKIFLFSSKIEGHPDILEEDEKFVKEMGAIGLIKKEVNLDDLVKKFREAIK